MVKELKSTDGTLIYAEATGDPSKPSVVFVHGFLLSGESFDNLFEDQKLLDKLYLVRYDVRSHGRSGKPQTMEGHASSLYADDFKTVIEAFNLRRPVFCGWSLGGSTGADICTYLDPIPLSGLVYMCAVPYLEPSVVEGTGRPDLRGLLTAVSTDGEVVDSINTRIKFMETLFKDHRSVPWKTKFSWMGSGVFMTPADCRFALGRPQDGSKLLEAGRNGLPLLVIAAGDDEQLDGEGTVRTFAPHFKNMKVARIANAGHAVHLDQQEEFVKTLIAFVLGECH
ncbi:alpha beta-hydrolase [Coniophora puteana RWD-64-598 SS2]|uniref:Alpha beta-hydrolase n=1 Tax=Coniophora puteana (strain RWD-64-598) TaxID=741705 RepID=A0A5M3N2H2_CONPW|nr:alpha beta-hydrolase [Coniophora puteana RWD-64-598 SS2]EIW85568.1 alpha beta-hydrolase [Coniophora puteana RWD-64-598 SS2]